jgi:LuxR family maltose regulon positive regulatory protein
LCDALIGETNSDTVLSDLQRRNLFIVPLDEEHRWYRYHHLFADLLGNLLRKELPAERIRELHLRACEWCEQNGLTAEAVSHALAAQDYDRTAQLIEDHSLTMVTQGEMATLLRWIEALPQDVAHSRPWLCIHQAWPLTLAGRADAAELLLQEIERQMPAKDLAPEGKEILGNVAAMQAMMALMRGDMPRAVELAQRADALLPPDNLIPRHTIPFILASAYSAEGELAKARQALAEELQFGRAADNVWTIVRALCDLADLEIIQGRLGGASDLCQDALQEAEERGARQFGTVGYALVKLGEINYERDDLIAARDLVSEGVRLMQSWQQPYEMVSGYTILAAILQALNEAEGAREALHNAEAIQAKYSSYPKLDSLVQGCRIRLCLAQDGPEEAARQATAARLGESGAPIFRERELMILARVLVARQRWDEALPLLARLEAEAEAGGRFGRLIEILVLQAVARQAQGDAVKAQSALERALAMGKPEGYVRVFVEQGTPLASLLQQAAARGIATQYVSKLLAAFGVEEEVPASQSPDAQPLPESLTPREMEVLHLICDGLSNWEIAECLTVTLNTVKKHSSHIYGKLGVSSRAQAIVRAQELGLC